MTDTSRSTHRTALLASAVAVLGLLTACGAGGDGTASGTRTPTGSATPVSGGRTADSAAGSAAGSATGSATTAPDATATATAVTSGATASHATTASGGRCHTSELRATVGPNDPGAGQEHFPVVLTNTSSRTCTVRGYPGAAFVDASGHQLGPDPKRSPGTPTTVTLAPGGSAWAGLSFSNPDVSGADPATPASLLVTPPNELDPLTVTWTGGQVPVSGNSSTVYLTVLRPGSGL
ncbi:DUF4232 domain-containing protein [Streptomyces sp. NPDC000987]|uniref:DUF4232 domain-containing protein n=1 Tax=Streptomyces sp. NPDC000987 TaxID=3154374 RepID=UPI00332F6441